VDQGIAFVLAAAIAATPPTVGLYIGFRASHHRQDVMQSKLDDTHAQVVTMNEGTLGSFAADDETRRIEAIPHDQRTAQEQRHVDSAPEPDAPQGHGR